MKKRWIEEEQMAEYEKLSPVEIKKKVINDLKEAIEWIESSNDYDSAYRMAGGAVEALYKYEKELINLD